MAPLWWGPLPGGHSPTPSAPLTTSAALSPSALYAGLLTFSLPFSLRGRRSEGADLSSSSSRSSIFAVLHYGVGEEVSGKEDPVGEDVPQLQKG